MGEAALDLDNAGSVHQVGDLAVKIQFGAFRCALLIVEPEGLLKGVKVVVRDHAITSSINQFSSAASSPPMI